MVELLIAASVLAIAGSILISSLVSVNRSAERSIERTMVTHLLANQLALLEDHADAQTTQQGTVTLAPDEFAWATDVADAAGMLAPLKQVTMTLTRDGRISRIVTYRPPPAQAP